MNDLFNLTPLQAAYGEALAHPLYALRHIFVTERSTKDQVREAFVQAYKSKHLTGCTTAIGLSRIEEGVTLFMSEQQIPDFVARYLTGITIAQQTSPP